ncbi:ABC transporter permease [Leptospira biflexa]|uniref:ABC transporter permease n=3 Tax=Leptospira biflexa TaxID=172 RepID=UPI001083A91C|nr:ABC transporter permease [Leptospira biflexa]TGM34534.1 ABC transporter permease [Leptospira biflexa]
MIHLYFHFIFSYFKSHLGKVFLNLLSVSLGIALFVSTQINGWKAEKSLIDQTIGFNSRNFIGRYVFTSNLTPNKPEKTILKKINDSLPNTVIVEPELQTKGYFKNEENQIFSIPTIGKDLITQFNFNLQIKNNDQFPKYIFSKALLSKLNTNGFPLLFHLCNKQIRINRSDILEISKDGLFVLMDIERLQNICNLKDNFTSINLIQSQNHSTILYDLPKTMTLENWYYESNEEIKERAGIALGSLKINLTIISLVSVLISFFMVSNIYTGLFISRKIEFGILLSIGGTKLNNFFLFLILSVFMGFIGGSIGVYLGVTISNQNLVKTVSTLTDTMQIESYNDYPIEIILYGISLSIFGSIVSALFNAIKAYNILPIELLRDRDQLTTNSPFFLSKHTILVISLFLILIGFFIGNIKIEKQILPGLAGVGFVIFGFVTLNYILIPYIINGIEKLTKNINLSPSFYMGIKEVGMESWKNGLIVSTIMLSTSLVFTLSTLTSSYQTSLKHWIADENKSDFSLINEEKLTSGEPGVPIDLFETLKSKNIFLDVEPFFINPKLTLNGKFFTLHVLNFPESLDKNRILVSKNLCFLEKICKGDTITLTTEKKGPVTLEIQEEKEHFFSERGTILMDFQLFKQLYTIEFLNSIRLTLKKDKNYHDGYRLIHNISKEYGLIHLDQIKLGELYLQGMDQVFSVLDTLKITAISISVLSLITSIFYYVKEKSRILAGLKAIGMSLSQLYFLLFYQILFLVTTGITSGIVNSLILSPIVVYGINRNAFGWDLAFTFPVHFVAKLPIIIPIFSAFITIIPFYFVSRMKISKELNYE